MAKLRKMSKYVKLLESTGSYWDKTGKYQREYNEIAERMPSMGSSDSLQVNIIIAMSKIYFDYYNNGFGNNWGYALLFLMKYADLPRKYSDRLGDYAAGNMALVSLESFLNEFADYCIEFAMNIDPDTPSPVGVYEISYNYDDPEQHGFAPLDDDEEEDDYDYYDVADEYDDED